MSNASEITVGTIAITKVGRNEVKVTVTEITANGWKVKSLSTEREFETRRIERIVAGPETKAPETEKTAAPEPEAKAPEAEAPKTEAAAPSEPETEVPETEAAAPAEPETEVPETDAAATDEPEADAPETDDEEGNAVNPAPESGSGPRPAKKLSLLNAAAQVLAACRTPMNCKEIVAKAVELGLWVHTGAKTPEQTLYGGIFREMKINEEPRFKKSAVRKGAFEYAKEQ